METVNPDDPRPQDIAQEEHFPSGHQVSQHLLDKKLPISEDRRHERIHFEQEWNGHYSNWNTLLHKSRGVEGYAVQWKM
jgi:hypothetical protein